MQRVRKIRKIQRPNQTAKNVYTERKPKPERIINRKDSKKIIVSPNVINTTKRKLNPREFVADSVEPIWKGETVFIIGGGPSLKNFNWESLRTKKTIAINKAFYAYPHADILYFTDGRFYNWYKDDIDLFKGEKYTITPGSASVTADVKILKRGQKLGLSKEKNMLSHGNNSGYAAINLAYLLGAKRIVLLGYDMTNDGTKSHFHDGYPVNMTSNSTYTNTFIPAFDSLAPLLKNSGIQVYNACEWSMLRAFPKISHAQALAFN